MRAMRKLNTFHRKQAIFGGVMERDDEGRALNTCVATLEKVESKTARKRIVRYLLERYVTPEFEASEQQLMGTVHAPARESALEPLTSEQSVALAKAKVLGCETPE